MITEVISFWGIVQGVGFRPTLSRLAAKYRMHGQARNMGAFVQLIVTDEPARIDAFIEAVQAGRPRMADIMRIDRKIIDTTPFDAFRIVLSADAGDEIAVAPADVAVCGECLAEFADPANPRYAHPFISCANCGPRYTIMERLPYDRDTTTMDDFPMCAFCESEYTNPASRRYHAQTVSCLDCGPQAIWRPGGARPPETDSLNADPRAAGSGGKRPPAPPDSARAAISEAVAAVRSGGVIALKGVGGYYFVCSPYDETAVRRLRDVKAREHKPFAVMFASAEDIRAYCALDAGEERLLTSPKRPIVLLEQRDAGGSSAGAGAPPPFAPATLSTSRFIGAFLPSMALQYTLIGALGPLVMTSANISDLPIIRDDDEMFGVIARDGRIAGALYNERRVIRRLDDSVARVIDGGARLIRRSKGWTPAPIYLRNADRLSKDDQIFAAGADLKSAFALTKGSFVYMSQYVGDMDNVETERVYGENLASMRDFFSVAPGVIAFDMHPLYRTSEIARDIAKDIEGKRAPSVRLLPVQHHHAHVASVMAEHGLTGPVIGVAFDGTGYGADGTIWGGEILICEGAGFERFSHLRDMEMIGGDSSMRDGWKSAICRMADARRSPGAARPGGDAPGSVFDIDISYALQYAGENDTLRDYREERRIVEAAVARGVNVVRTSSVGRLFDAVASLLGVRHVNRYEGECAVTLENAAWRALAVRAQAGPAPSCGEGPPASAPPGADALALRFHLDVAQAILTECRRARAERGTDAVCLSGGVFQNKILTEEALRLLRDDGFTPYLNVAVPPNDGGVALGQAYIAARRVTFA